MVYPNPFTETTQISILAKGISNLMIFDNLGRKVNTQSKFCTSGVNIFNWDGVSKSGEKLSTGIYTFIIETEQEIIRGKISLVK